MAQLRSVFLFIHELISEIKKKPVANVSVEQHHEGWLVTLDLDLCNM